MADSWQQAVVGLWPIMRVKKTRLVFMGKGAGHGYKMYITLAGNRMNHVTLSALLVVS